MLIRMKKLLIRPLRDDAEARDCTAQLGEFGPWRILGITPERIFKDLTNPARAVFVAESDGQIIGVLVLHLGGSFDGYIQLIAVFPEFQSRGFGSQIVRFAEEKIFCQSKNVFLCVSAFNNRAQKFYGRLGYRRVGELPDFLVAGQAEILMRKTTGPLLAFAPQK